MSQRFWIGVACREHVQRGLAEGFCQLGHGKTGSLKRMRRGDWLVYYSSKERMGSGEACQRFTAIGTITDEEPEQVEMSPDFRPWRRKIDYLASSEVEIRPLIPMLEFIPNKKNWGGAFRYGFLEISEFDFLRIKESMLEPGRP